MNTCIVVDAYRFSKDYIFHLKNKNIKAIHIQSTIEPLEEFASSSSYTPNDYIENFIFDGSLKELIRELKPYKIIGVISGTEPGVELADLIATLLKCKANDRATIKARRDKYLMQLSLKKNNVPCMKFLNANNPESLIQWINQNTTYPVVLKPLQSAATDGVFVCETENEVRNRFIEIYGKINCLGLTNDSVLVEEFLKGTEYMVNSVSCKGKHYYTDIWKCTKRYLKGQGIIYDREELLDSTGEIQGEICKYMNLVLNTLGVKFGSVHAEIMYTHDGPRLIEIGARVGGNVNCDAHTKCLGLNQLELTIDAYTDEPAFDEKRKEPYQLKYNAMTILLSSVQTGTIKAIPIEKIIKNCHTAYWYHLSVKPDDYLKKTVDLFTSPGKVILIHKNKTLINDEYEILMKSMINGFILKPEKVALNE